MTVINLRPFDQGWDDAPTRDGTAIGESPTLAHRPRYLEPSVENRWHDSPDDIALPNRADHFIWHSSNVNKFVIGDD